MFVANPNQVQRVPEKVSEKVWEALVAEPVSEKVHRVPEEVPEKEVSEKVPGGFVQSQGFGAEAGQVQQGF